MKIKKPPRDIPSHADIILYLEHQLFARLKGNWKPSVSSLNVSIGLGCPHHPVYVLFRSSELEKQAALILKDLGLPGELTECFEWPSISGRSLQEYGEANKEKIIAWIKQQKAKNGEAA